MRDSELREEFKRCRDMAVIRLRHAGLNGPAIKVKCASLKISGRLTKAGGYAEIGRNRITLSRPLLSRLENRSKVRNTILHELAHLAAPPYQPNEYSNWRMHHAEWRRVCKLIGGDGKRCHTMETEPTRKRDGWAKAMCDRCKVKMEIGPVRVKRMLKGTKYMHAGCGGKAVLAEGAVA